MKPLLRILLCLAICRLAEPIALTSIFPYAFLLVRHFNVGDPSNASLYAGFLISAFALAESLTGLYWGSLSDRIGRKPILLFGCTGTMLSLLVVGFASSFWVALLGRALGGFLNGNVGVIQTMVGELVTRPEHEREFLQHRLAHVVSVDDRLILSGRADVENLTQLAHMP